MRDGLRDTLPGRPLKVINVGLEGFAQDLERQGVAVVRVDWRSPASRSSRTGHPISTKGFCQGYRGAVTTSSIPMALILIRTKAQ